jgi:adenylate kinase
MGKSAATPRHRPNVLITGTPGTGKSSLAERVAAAVDDLKRIDVSQLAKDGDMLESFDATHDTHVIDEDKVLDHMEEHGLGGDAGGVVVDYHGCDLFPERWFDLVVVLTCDNGVLYDRLQARGYSDTKIRGNVECEIFQTLIEEAKESYDEDIVKVCASDSIEDMEENEKSICEFIRNWKSTKESS